MGICGWVGWLFGGREEGTIKDSCREGLKLDFNGQRVIESMVKGM